jgi:hypothetical protein
MLTRHQTGKTSDVRLRAFRAHNALNYKYKKSSTLVYFRHPTYSLLLISKMTTLRYLIFILVMGWTVSVELQPLVGPVPTKRTTD